MTCCLTSRKWGVVADDYRRERGRGSGRLRDPAGRTPLMPLVPVPTDLGTVLSADWLTQALQVAYPGVVVAAAREVGRVESTALKVRIEIDYSDRAGHDPLSRLFAKGY